LQKIPPGKLKTTTNLSAQILAHFFEQEADDETKINSLKSNKYSICALYRERRFEFSIGFEHVSFARARVSREIISSIRA
jgi:hypothetical protein